MFTWATLSQRQYHGQFGNNISQEIHIYTLETVDWLPADPELVQEIKKQL